jgi:DNA polymerase-3 subunit alpha
LPEALANTPRSSRSAATVAAPKRKPILPSLAGDREGEATTLRSDARAGLEARLEKAGIADDAARETYFARLDFELDVIIQMGFPGYFLIVADFIKWAKSHGIPVGPGRGSGAGSVVAWSLTITDLDPIKLGLSSSASSIPSACRCRLRHRLLRNPPRRGDPLRPGEIWPRPCRADHHLRDDEGARGAQGYRPRAPDELLARSTALAKLIPEPPDDPRTLERTLNGVSREPWPPRVTEPDAAVRHP